ncbi:MAG: DUF4446 family protein [Actinobacteria bacterium]|nr:DUF4446 family protein [Actinomycetota bacterium]
MVLSEQVVGVVVLVLVAAVAVLAGVVVVLLMRQRRLQRAYAAVLDPDRREDLFQALERHVAEVDRLRDDLGVVHHNTERLRELLRDTVSRVGVVRYDAFEEMGGALSFSAALLDERGDGVVLTAINGRAEARTYAKPIAGGSSEHNLSPEEQQAIDAALDGAGGAALEAPRRRRRRAAS